MIKSCDLLIEQKNKFFARKLWENYVFSYSEKQYTAARHVVAAMKTFCKKNKLT